MRVKTHPDQVKREHPNMTEEELRKVTVLSAKVGEAADVLEDPSQVCGLALLLGVRDIY